MKLLALSDLHFTNRQADEHFFNLFPLVQDLITKHQINRIILAGDLTNAKDNHCSQLVNRTVNGLIDWANMVPLDILMGNHDYAADSESPYFEFLGRYPNVTYHRKPSVSAGRRILFLPHTKDPQTDWKGFEMRDKVVFAHVTVKGAVYEAGLSATEGVDPEIFASADKAFSGDIHSRQTIGPLTYIGCPYQVRFNDKFQGGAILVDLTADSLDWQYLNFDFPKRLTLSTKTVSSLVTQLEDLKVGDQVKIRLHLDQKNMGKWREIRDEIRKELSDRGITLHAFEMIKDFNDTVPISSAPERKFTDFTQFCEHQKINKDLQKIGEEIIGEVSCT